MYPTTPVVPLAFQVRSTLCGTGACPLPVSDSTVGAFDALLRKVRLAVAAPVAFGVKVTVNEADWPADRVFGKVIPDSTNSLVLLLPEVIVTEAPAAVRLPGRAEFAPTVTLPKLSVAGVTDNVPSAPPVPDILILSVELEASEITAKVPLTAPVAAGVNFAVKVTL